MSSESEDVPADIRHLPETVASLASRMLKFVVWFQTSYQEDRMSTIVLVILVLLLVGALPTWPYSRSWGYYPSGGLGLIVLILLVLALSGRV